MQGGRGRGRRGRGARREEEGEEKGFRRRRGEEGARCKAACRKWQRWQASNRIRAVCILLQDLVHLNFEDHGPDAASRIVTVLQFEASKKGICCGIVFAHDQARLKALGRVQQQH